MTDVGLRELRQEASALVRRAQSGEVITITVAGRPAACLTAPPPAPWCRWEDLRGVFAGPNDPDWEHDRELIADDVRDPWGAT